MERDKHQEIADELVNQGKQELSKHLNGEKLTKEQAILAKCYTCVVSYTDGKKYCKVESCALYPFSPYHERSKPRIKERYEF